MRRVELTEEEWENVEHNKRVYTAIVATSEKDMSEPARIIREIAKGYLNLVASLEKGSV